VSVVGRGPPPSSCGARRGDAAGITAEPLPSSLRPVALAGISALVPAPRPAITPREGAALAASLPGTKGARGRTADGNVTGGASSSSDSGTPRPKRSTSSPVATARPRWLATKAGPSRGADPYSADNKVRRMQRHPPPRQHAHKHTLSSSWARRAAPMTVQCCDRAASNELSASSSTPWALQTQCTSSDSKGGGKGWHYTWAMGAEERASENAVNAPSSHSHPWVGPARGRPQHPRQCRRGQATPRPRAQQQAHRARSPGDDDAPRQA
jgi:hypothetical protein